MVTHWKTVPIAITMDNPLTRPSTHALSRPQVFVKVEFGVSWSAQHAPRKHTIDWKSRALRDRPAHFPRHVPAPNTNYLAGAVAAPPQPPPPANPEQNAAQLNLLPPQESESESFPQRSRLRQVDFAPEPDVRYPAVARRRSRATVRSPSLDSHDRGRSAPPPLSENDWDVIHSRATSTATATAAAAAAAATTTASSAAYPSTSQRPKSDVWKDLPELPSKYRLGEDDMPWEGTWSFPMGWEPFLEPDPYLQPPMSASSSKPSLAKLTTQASSSEDLPTTPTVVNIQTPVHDTSRSLQQDPARRSDLEALGSAMMTVDNGFENQWWNQGERVAIHPSPTTRNQAQEQMALGWVGALLPTGSEDNQRHFSLDTVPDSELEGDNEGPTLRNMVVSPVSSYSGPMHGLSRTLSTRSEELWLSGPRYT